MKAKQLLIQLGWDIQTMNSVELEATEEAMKEYAKQALELAAERADIHSLCEQHNCRISKDLIDKQSILSIIDDIE